MKCPHCRVEIHPEPKAFPIGVDKDEGWFLATVLCPACNRFILKLQNGYPLHGPGGQLHSLSSVRNSYLVRPKVSARPPCPADVPNEIAQDYSEAGLVLADSPKASAALSRRCLQTLLRTAGGVKPGDLLTEIEQVLTTLPSHLANAIDAIRNVGNFAAHPQKAKQTGEILPVEPGEAEWSLDVLEQLFDFYYVQPAQLAMKREAMNKKLQEAGKPPMK